MTSSFANHPTIPLLNVTPDATFTLCTKEVALRDYAETFIIKIIENYENEYKVFTALGISHGKSIFDEIQNFFFLNLNIEIKTLFLEDYPSFSMVLAAVYCRKKALNIEIRKNMQCIVVKPNQVCLLEECQHPLHTIMVMCYAAHYMRKFSGKNYSVQILRQNDYIQLKEELEQLACKVITHLQLNGEQGPRQAIEALQADYTSSFSQSRKDSSKSYRDYIIEKSQRSLEIMAIAYKAKAMARRSRSE